jgi:hypothetical protein
MTTLNQTAPVTLAYTLEGDICRYAVQQIEEHIRAHHERFLWRIEMYDFQEARSIRKYLRNYWKEILPANRGEIHYWPYALREMIRRFYTKTYHHLPLSALRSIRQQVDAALIAQWEYLETLEDDGWLEDLYEEFHPDKVLSKIRIPTKDPREQGTKVESAAGQQTGTA